jgi:hypothetical protein
METMLPKRLVEVLQARELIPDLPRLADVSHAPARCRSPPSCLPPGR